MQKLNLAGVRNKKYSTSQSQSLLNWVKFSEFQILGFLRHSISNTGYASKFNLFHYYFLNCPSFDCTHTRVFKILNFVLLGFKLMEPNGIQGGMFSNMTSSSSGMLGLEMSLQHHHQHHMPPQNPNQLPPHHHQRQQMVAFGNPEAQQGPPAYPFASKPKPLTISDEDEPNPTTEESGDGKRKVSPWQRMKWTDSMVRLLIMVVFYIGDEVGSDQAGPDPGGKKKGAGVLQKKGKWKSVSRAMMERGFFVSPQQCEDKFNDLNKRYKRVNDILGKGTACRVVENQALLETMDHLSPKMKEEVKKLLNSKHLFFREMCAYHNSCGGSAGGNGSGSGGGGGGVHQSPPEVQHETAQSQQQMRCLHSNDKNAATPSRADTERSRMEADDDGDDEDDSEDDDVDYEDDEDDVVQTVHHKNGHNDQDVLERSSRKKQRGETALVQQFSNELMGVVQDVTKSLWEKRQWMKTRLLQLEEAKMGYQGKSFELEKQRMKWLKFSWKKEREMEGEKLKNERLKLENDRMVLLLRQKELELLGFQQPSSNKRGDPSSVTG